MRLSETGKSRGSRMQRPSPAEQEEGNQRAPRLWKAGLSIGALVVLVAATIGAFALGRSMVTHAAAQLNQDCTLIVPKNPLTAVGLATPYQLVATDPNQGPCNESNPMQSAFVQGAVLDPATGQISVYNPLVIDQGTQPAIQPTIPTLPAGAIVALWFGSNGNVLRLRGDTRGGNCINGLGDSPFGQFAYCNATRFFRLARAMIQAGLLTPPPLGTAQDGMPCPTVRDFSVVDQDQSDNVTTVYLVRPNGQTAQNTPANQAALPDAQVQKNGSDNGLLAGPLDSALGCHPWAVPDLADPAHPQMLTALPLNELQASMLQQAPVALVPLGDPMTQRNGNPSLIKTNLYRAGVDQPAANEQQASTTAYCKNLLQIGPARLQKDMGLTMNVASPAADVATNLFTFLAQRFNASFGPNNLNCTGLLNVQNPVTLQQDANGVTTGATITLPGQGNGGNNGQPTPTPTTPPAPTATVSPPTGGNGNGPTCVVNGVTVQGCMGTTIINGQTCAITYDAAMKQVTITCQQQG